MTHSENQVLALAAIIQAATLVDQIARTGAAPSEQVNPLIQSIFEFDPPSTDAIFSGVHNLDEGLNQFLRLMTGQQKSHNPAVVRYSLGILHLQKQASSQSGLFDVLHNRLSHASIKAEHFSNNINEITHTLSASS